MCVWVCAVGECVVTAEGQRAMDIFSMEMVANYHVDGEV